MQPDIAKYNERQDPLGLPRFGGHRDRSENGPGGVRWEQVGGGLAGSSSWRRCG